MASKKRRPQPGPPEEQRTLELLREALGFVLSREEADQAVYSVENRLGGVANALRTPLPQLESLPGMDSRSARFLALILELTACCMRESTSGLKRILDFPSAVRLLRPEFVGRRVECVGVILLDGRSTLLYSGVIAEGSTGTVPLSLQRVVRLCVEHNASMVVLAHNHPTGSALPSPEDVLATDQAIYALAGIGVSLQDHLIFSQDGEFSFADSGLLAPLSKAVYESRQACIHSARQLVRGYMSGCAAPAPSGPTEPGQDTLESDHPLGGYDYGL